MVRVVELRRFGDPYELCGLDVDLPSPGAGEVRLRQTAIGVNYHDVYVRSGLYQTLPLPGVPGIEAVGIVTELGPGVAELEVGDRIGYVSSRYGAYASQRNLPAQLAIKLPSTLNDAPAAASLMKALTVCMLVRHVRQIAAGETLLVHAAAGGVGQLLCGWASHLGATVIGTVGDDAKAQIARSAGAAHIINYRRENVAERVAQMTNGEGVAAAYDSVGADTFQSSIDSLGFTGKLINFGQTSGPVAPFSPALLATRSLSICRPVIFHYLRTPERLQTLARETLDAFEKGVIHPIDPLILPMEEAPRAHLLLEGRQSPGGIVLMP